MAGQLKALIQESCLGRLFPLSPCTTQGACFFPCTDVSEASWMEWKVWCVSIPSLCFQTNPSCLGWGWASWSLLCYWGSSFPQQSIAQTLGKYVPKISLEGAKQFYESSYDWESFTHIYLWIMESRTWILEIRVGVEHACWVARALYIAAIQMGIGSDDWFLQMQALKDFGHVI